MSRARALAVLLLALTAAACTVVVPGGKDGGTKFIPIPIRPDALPPPKPLEASVLYVVNLQRSSANLAEPYANIMIGFAGYLQSLGLSLSHMGVIPTYADEFGPRLLLGRTQAAGGTPSITLLAALAAAADAGVTDYASLIPFIAGALGNISDADLAIALKLLASSGRFDGDEETSEPKNLVGFGRGLDIAPLPAELGGISRSALFDRPRDLFLIVYLQPLDRHCALGSAACQIDGRSLPDALTETNADGGLAWLRFSEGSLRPEQVVHVAIATKEGETVDAFRKRCGAVPGFPLNLFDVMAPASNAYFTPLMLALNAAHRGTGHIGDFCELIGSSPQDAIKKLGNSVAAVVGRN
jgi:hypothetical protein